MPDVLFGFDQSRSFYDQEVPPHNRWHPDVPPVATVRPGTEFRLECREWFDGTVHNDDSADDIRNLDLSIVHPLSGPISVEGAEPGDLLVVDVLDLGPVPQESGPVAGQGWGYTGIFARDNGGGFLTDRFPDAHKAIWDFRGQKATSRHLPGVGFTGIAHPGIIGTAPSHELLAEWNRRERELIATDPNAVPPLALPPEPQNALLGTLEGDEAERAAEEAARTAPPRENGGNQDIKNLTRGSRVFMPVFVEGGKLSAGDLHFSQGDGEITFCGAIEMGGYLDLGVDLIKGGMEAYGVTSNPLFFPGDVEPPSRPTSCSARRRSRAASAASWTYRTRARHCICRRRSSTSTSDLRPKARAGPTGEVPRAERPSTTSARPPLRTERTERSGRNLPADAARGET
jgi:formamidase